MPPPLWRNAKSIVEEAYAGDVIGLYDTGNFKIGDTVSEGKSFYFRGIPEFSPEIFKELVNRDPMKSKQLDKGIRQLTEEGVAQLFIKQPGNIKIVGTVGELQFDVIKYRLKNEYGAECSFKPLNYHMACWITSNDQKALDTFVKRKAGYIVYDKSENPVFLALSQWLLQNERDNNPDIVFHTTSEFKTEVGVS